MSVSENTVGQTGPIGPAGPAVPVRLLGTPAAVELHRAVNQTESPYPGEESVVELFERCVELYAENAAVVQGKRRVTYAGLERMANVQAARLREQGVVPGEAVAVCMERSPELIAALIAVLKCGAAYLPVGADWPSERHRDLFDQSGVRVLLTDRPEPFAAGFPGLRVLDPAAQGDDADAVDPPNLRISPDAVAYINFTSGSTGHPKGVPIRHRSISRLVFGARYATLNEHTVLLHMAPVTFDAATFEIWGALLHGGTCVLYPSQFPRFSQLRRILEAERVNVVFLTTALFNSIVDESPQTLDRCGTVLTGGEAHSLRHMARALALYGPKRIVSVYGPTEATTFATYYPVRALAPDETALPIGRPIQNTRVYVADGSRLCDAGDVGEVLLAGPGLSPGYLGLPEENAKRFVEFEVDGAIERVYRTGDRAYLRPDGVLVFQGRLDEQVKISGHRIELGEIAHHLDALPGVRQSYVTVVEDPTGVAGRSLAAFIVPSRSDTDAESVRKWLAQSLPPYMVPHRIRLCESFPLSATGKVDRTALLAFEP
jgi:D-alanine--poly(phosphoribitol) ligase subunit 1